MTHDSTTIPPMPTPNFNGMAGHALRTYLKANQCFLQPTDAVDTLDGMRVTAALVADRKALGYLAARAQARELNAEVDKTSTALQAYPKGPMGLTTDAVKATPAWKAASSAYAIAFSRLRQFNGTYTKLFAAELAYERQYAREAKLKAIAA